MFERVNFSSIRSQYMLIDVLNNTEMRTDIQANKFFFEFV